MSDPELRDRIKKLLADPPPAVNGIDFVEVMNQQQTVLHVHFLNKVTVAPTLTGPHPVTITGGERVREVPVTGMGWLTDVHSRPLLELTVAAPGDFSFYTLAIESAALDPFFNSVTFSFKALCDSTLDCEPPSHECPPPAGDVPPIDYLAKDFRSFRKALSEFSSLRYPDWIEGDEPDFGVMFMEALCKVGDDLSYLQDRISWEATLETATQRRSVVRHARMVDYEPRPAIASSVLLQFDVPPAVTSLPPAIVVTASAPDGAVIEFETGTGLGDRTQYPVHALLNRSAAIRVYYRDDSENCLRAGATSMRLAGHLPLPRGTALLIDTRAVVSADPPVREVVHLIEDGGPDHDAIFHADFTHVVWHPDEALQFDHDVTIDVSGDSRTLVAGNLVPATQGKRSTEVFAIDVAPPLSATPLAVVRQGPPGRETPPRYLHTLRDAPLAFLPAPVAGDAPLPEIELQQQSATPQNWAWKRRLLDAGAGDRAFTTEPYRLVRAGALPGGPPFYEEDGDGGQTIRFGDGTFGGVPDAGTIFRLTYRVGGGARGNVAADAIASVAPSSPIAGLVVMNPFVAAGGADEEPNERVRRLAPQAFRAVQFRAVRPEDYSHAAETLSWVSKAGSELRWTGSWLTMFTTVDPKGNAAPSIPQRIELSETLDRWRMAGRDVYMPDPEYVALDIVVTVCARPEAQRGDVEAAVGAVLSPSKRDGFFNPDRFTFGTPLYRSRLESVIQSVPGVAGIVAIVFRRRGRNLTPIPLRAVFAVGTHEIIRVDNDRNRPENGSITLDVRGGR